MDFSATLGHAEVSDLVSRRQNGSTKPKNKPNGQKVIKTISSSPQSRISVDYRLLLQILKASKDKPGKQVTLITERVDVCLGKKAEPGTKAIDVQRIKKISVRLQSSDGVCKQVLKNDGSTICIDKSQEPKTAASIHDPALRVFCCAKCSRLIEYEIEAIPHLGNPKAESVWDEFAVQVCFEQAPDALASVFVVKSTFEFASIMHSFAKPDTMAIAVSADMRLMAKMKVPGQDGEPISLTPNNPTIEVKLVDKPLVLHSIELEMDSVVKALNFSHDATLLMATIQESMENTSLMVWSMVSGKEVQCFKQNPGSTVLASFSSDGERVFAISLYNEAAKGEPVVALEVNFLKQSPDMSERFSTGAMSIAELEKLEMEKRSSGGDEKPMSPTNDDRSAQYASGDGSVVVYNTGEYTVYGEQGNIVYLFTSRVHPESGGEREGRGANRLPKRKDAVSLDLKNRKTRGRAPFLHQKVLKFLQAHAQTVISKASISSDGNVFAHVFDKGHSHPAAPRVATEGLPFQVHLPSDKLVLVWNLKTGELCHRFEHDRSVTCVHVSTDGTILLVGVSGSVAANHLPSTRLERSAVLVYSLITREVLWEVPLMHEVLETKLTESSLLFKIDVASDFPASSVFAIPTNEIAPFPCATTVNDTSVTELQLVFQMGTNLSVVTAEELSSGLEATSVMSYRSGPSEVPTPKELRRQGSLLSPEHMKRSPQQSWRSSATYKRMSGLSVSGDGQSYVAKWVGQGDSGRSVWLSVGDVLWEKGVLHHRRNLQLLQADEGEGTPPVKIGAFCISHDGDVVACSVDGTCRVVVLQVPANDDAGEEKVLWELDADVVPRAIGVLGETLSVMGDREVQVTFAQREAIVQCYSLVTRVLVSKSTHKCSGRTLGIDGSGVLRVSMSEDHRVFLERFATGEMLYQVFDHNMQFMGVSGAGDRIIMKDTGHHDSDSPCPCGKTKQDMSTKGQRNSSAGEGKERTNHCLLQINLPNFELFGPSRRTCGTWIASGEMASMFSVHKARLSRWLLADQVVYKPTGDQTSSGKKSCFTTWCKDAVEESRQLTAFPGRWSKTVSKLVRDKDYDSVNLILEACPVVWACLVYTDKEEVMSNVHDQDATNFFLHALANNDRLLVQLLLGAVKTIVELDKGAHCPVTQMGQVTEFLTQCLKQSRMTDIVEQFLRDLPLIKVDESDERKHVRSHFKRGRVISTGWSSRDAEGLTGPWGLKPTTKEAEDELNELHIQSTKDKHLWVSSSENMERGYQYVVALPGLCDQEFLELITAYHASPSLIDNESMRAATRVLEGDLQTMFLGIPVSWHFVSFLLCLACFCAFVELCITHVQDDGFSKYSRDEIWETTNGKVGIVFGAVSTLLNFVFLLRELLKMFNSRPIWTYVKPWNIIPWLSNLTAITNFVCFCLDSSNIILRSTAAFSMLLLWATSFTFLRSVRKLSALVNMLLEIMNDMLMFVLVVVILLISFAGALYCLHGKILPEIEREDTLDGQIPSGPSENVFLTAVDSIGRAFVMSVLSTFDVNQLRSPLQPVGALTNISFVFFFGLVMLVSVVGMNALIAIMGNSFTRVAEMEHAVRNKEVASVLLDKLRNFPKEKKTRWQKQRRWVHVLSPSEKGSLILNGNNTVTDIIKREIRSFELRNETQIKHLHEMIQQHQDANNENASTLRDLDNAARLGLQDSGNKTNKLIGMFKKLQDDQSAVFTEVKALKSTVRALQDKVEYVQNKAAGQPGNMRELENLPEKFKQVEANQEIAMTQMANVQRDLSRVLSQLQSFEWQLGGVEQTARTTSAILAPLHASLEREWRSDEDD